MSKLDGLKSLLIIQILFFASFFIYNAAFFNLFNSKSTQHVKSKSAEYQIELDKYENYSFPFKDGKLILMLIDAMRYDFIFDKSRFDKNSKEKSRMPFVNRLLREKKAIPFYLSAKPPTVTLPRIKVCQFQRAIFYFIFRNKNFLNAAIYLLAGIFKAIVSGIIPEFIDILWNFNTTRLNEDNLLKKFRQSNKSIVFYGDDTWLKLFDPPGDYFLRYEGTTSFIASDYDEVDQNVTRNLNLELFEKQSSDWSMMILHYLGLDHVGHIEGPFAPYNIKRKLHEMDEIVHKIYSKLERNDLLLILSDHGMANEGGHGGSSTMETQTPALFVSDYFLDYLECGESHAEIKSRQQIDLVSTLSCLFDLSIPESNRGVSFLRDIFGKECLLERKVDLEMKHRKCLIRNLNQLNSQFGFVKNKNEIEHFLLPNQDAQSFLELNEKFDKLIREKMSEISGDKEEKNRQTFHLVLSILLLFSLYLFSMSICVKPKEKLNKIKILFNLVQTQAFLKLFYSLAILLNLASLLSSSFIEEEHQMWYFLETSQIYLLVLHSFDLKTIMKKINSLKLICFLLVVRFSRSINQTGNKWVHLRDLADLLRENPSKVPLILVAFASLTMIYIVGNRFMNKSLAKLSFLCIFAFHFATNLEIFSLHSRNLIAQLAYVIIAINLAENLLDRCRKNNTSFNNVFEILSDNWLLLNCLIQPTHNLLIVLSWLLKKLLFNSLFIETRLLNKTSKFYAFYFYMSMGQSGFFAQGNSNSLNSIQISSGFVGINQLNEALVGFLLFCSTFASNIYSFFNLAAFCLNSIENETRASYVKLHFGFTDSIVMLYSINCFVQREHLFVWSVFAPKLIYQLAKLFLDLVLMLVFCILC